MTSSRIWENTRGLNLAVSYDPKGEYYLECNRLYFKVGKKRSIELQFCW